MDGLIAWLTRVATVAASAVPAIAALAACVTISVGLWGTISLVAEQGVNVSGELSDYIERFVEYASDVVEDSEEQSPGFVLTLFQCLSIDFLMQLALIDVGVILAVIGLIFSVFATLFEGAVAVFVYRKTKLLANALSGQGVSE